MTEPTDAELIAFAVETGMRVRTGKGVVSFARAVLARWGQPAVAGKPVAWLSPWRADQVTTDYDAYGKHGIPLYTAPQPVEREPLTDEQIDQAIAELGLNYLADAHATNRAVLRKLCHHAHDIKGGQHGADT